MSVEQDLQPGDCLAGRYVILEEIGRGGFGVVYRAVQEGVNRHVALKTIRRQRVEIENFDFVEAFRREALLTSKLKHPNTITLFDYGETDEGMLYLVTEFLDGETLYERLWKAKKILAEATIEIGKQVAKSLGEAHAGGIIHGDLKPANIFLCQMYGEKDFVKVLDFGIAKIIGEVDPAGLGTPEYMSPEQFAGQPLLAASDIYSLGLILYEMLVGTRPFEDKDTGVLAERHINEPLPPLPTEVENSELGQIIRRATRKEPSERYANGLAMFKALDAVRLQNSSAIRLPPASPSSLSSSGKNHHGRLRPPLPSVRSKLSAPLTSLTYHRDKSGSLPLVGREAQQHWLHAQSSRVRRKRVGQIILMGGNAGLGKTRLCRWLIEEGSPADALAGQGAFEANARHAMGALSKALSSALGVPTARNRDTMVSRLEQNIGELINRELSNDERDALRALWGRHGHSATLETLAKVASLLLTLARQRLVVLHLDNMRWSDKQTFEVLEMLAVQMAHQQTRLLIICTVRRETLSGVPEVAAGLKKLLAHPGHVQAWTISEMTPAETLSYTTQEAYRALEDMQGEPSPKLLEAIATQSNGNPLYINQLFKGLLREDLLLNNGDEITLKPNVKLSSFIPRSLRKFTKQHLKSFLGKHPQREHLEMILTRLALLGHQVPLTLLKNILKRETDSGNQKATRVLARLSVYLQQLSEQDIIVLPERLDDKGHILRSVRFSQPLTRSVYYEQLQNKAENRVLHHHAAKVKYRHYRACGELEEHLVEIGSHHELAGDIDNATPHLQEAARIAVRRMDVPTASTLLERCRALYEGDPDQDEERLRVLVALSQLKYELGNLADFEALQALSLRLAQELEDSTAVYELELQSAAMALHAGQLPQADKILKAVLEKFSAQLEPPEELPQSLQKLDPTAQWMDMAPLPPTVAMGWALLLHTRVLREMGRLEQADQCLEEAADLFRTLGHHWGIAQCHMELAHCVLARHQPKHALSFLDQAQKHLQHITERSTLTRCHMLRAKAQTRLGNLEAARTLLIDTITALDGHRSGDIARCQAMLGTITAAQGDVEEAYEYFEVAVGECRTLGTRLALLGNLMEATDFYLEHGYHNRGANALKEALELLRTCQARRHTPNAQLLMGRLEAACNNPEAASTWYARSLQMSKRLGDPTGIVRAHTMQARLIEVDQSDTQFTTSISHLEAALRRAEQSGLLVSDLLRAKEALAIAYRRQHQPAPALELLRAAITGWRLLGNVNESVRLDAIRAHTPLAPHLQPVHPTQGDP